VVPLVGRVLGVGCGGLEVGVVLGWAVGAVLTDGDVELPIGAPGSSEQLTAAVTTARATSTAEGRLIFITATLSPSGQRLQRDAHRLGPVPGGTRHRA